MPYAFRCSFCGHLEGAGNAGECHVPHSCRVCRRGVIFAPTLDAALAHEHATPHREALTALGKAHCARPPHAGGRCIDISLPGMPAVKVLIHENWEVLADATDERLAELGLTRTDVVRHTPGAATSAGPARVLERSAADGIHTEDGAG